MPRGPRFIPPDWTVEIVTKTVCDFFLLPATAQFARIFVGILARAQQRHPVRIHAAVALSNHYHLIVTPDDPEQLADFMEFVNGNVAREAGRLIGWRGRFWSGRYHSVPISPEPEAMEERLRYVLSHAVKEDLVTRVLDWDGLHCAAALMEGTPLQGIWYDRTGQYEAERQTARRGGDTKEIRRGEFMTPYQLKLAPLPCWREWPKAQIRKRAAAMVEDVDHEAAKRRAVEGIQPAGMERIRIQDPLGRPTRVERRPKPLCHAASRKMRERVREAYRGFVEMFRAATEAVKAGRTTDATFPWGSFPPGLPFVRNGQVFDPLACLGASSDAVLCFAGAS